MGKIVWLASYPKSGNTWVRAFLHNYIAQPDTPQSINSLTDFSVAEAAAAFFHKPGEVPDVAEVQRLRPSVHESLTRLHDDLVFVKTHNANLAVHNIPLCTPAFTAGAIVIVRDPRDVALSYAAFTGQTVDETIAFMANKHAANRSNGTQVFELLSSWSDHVVSWVGAKNRLLLRYEDLLADPEKGFGRIVRFLGGPDDAPDPARLRRAIEFSSFKILANQEATTGYKAGSPTATAPFFRTGLSGQWRTGLTADQAARITQDHGAIMQKLGY